ncbi:hypothetical protein [Desulfopila inferna]|uniref:hypothetical protein n=1 Tax=Desulfopila inferna TaxID=468528 RepID=UPI00196533DC|nr:hypothetical protein [Desulfopila inferna]MBM9605246.1 hypothetical protein [Desulfopila inferna]
MDKVIILSAVSIVVYIIGGLAVFSGIGLIFFMKTKNLWGLGEGAPLGYLLFCVGLALSGIGVLSMRILRNRH